MLNIKITPQGWTEARNKLSQLLPTQQRAMVRTLNIFLLNVLRDSKTKPPRVPVDTGALQSSGFTEPIKVQGDQISATIGYGDESIVTYAVYVHEAPPTRQFKRPGSGPKFLETHLEARKEELQENLENALGEGAKELFSNG